MKNKMIIMSWIISVCLSLCACGNSIDPVSQKVVDDISSIGEVTLEDKEIITKTLEVYSTLTDEQKKQVKNYSTLLEASDKLEVLIAEANKPIELTVNNIEDYLMINTFSDEFEEKIVPGLISKEYNYAYRVTCDIKPKESLYYENVKITVHWTLKWGGLNATYEVILNDKGEGTYSHNQKFDSGISKLNDYMTFFSVDNYEIVEVSGKVYNQRPE